MDLWWPNGYGDQKLYELEVKYTAIDGQVTSKKNMRIGFRDIKLIQKPIGNKNYYKCLDRFNSNFQVTDFRFILK